MNEEMPFLDLSPQTQALWSELSDSVLGVMKSGNYIGGPWVSQFEKAVEEYTKAKHAIALNSGTDALVIGLRGLGIGPGDEVITSAFSFFATAESISMVGAKPVFVDIDPDTFNLDCSKIESRITSRTKAIMPVHLFGQTSDLEEIYQVANSHGLRVVEDAAQAFGSEYEGEKVGSRGDMATFSFFPTKNLGAFGDGGMLVTNDGEVAEKAISLRAHGGRNKYYNEMLGYNSRLDSIQAAILLVKLKGIEKANGGRRAAAMRYNDLLESEFVVTPKESSNRKHIYHQYTVRIKNGRRDEIAEGMKQEGIPTMVYYKTPIHKLPVYAEMDFGSLPETERAASEVLSLPLWPEITSEQQERVANAFLKNLG